MTVESLKNSIAPVQCNLIAETFIGVLLALSIPSLKTKRSYDTIIDISNEESGGKADGNKN